MGKARRREPEKPVRKKKRKKGHKIYAFIVLVLGIAIIAMSVLLLFHVQRIEVVGNEYSKDRDIVKVVQNDKYSVNTLYILGKYALGHGGSLPCLNSIKVSVTRPWALKVTVREKPIVGFIYTENEYAYFDKEGMIVYKGTEFIDGLPNIEGLSTGTISLYKTIETNDKGIFEEILETSQEISRYELDIDKIVCREDNIYLYIGEICVALGDTVSPEQIAQVSPIVEQLEGQTGTLHLENFTESAGTITFNKGELPEEN